MVTGGVRFTREIDSLLQSLTKSILLFLSKTKQSGLLHFVFLFFSFLLAMTFVRDVVCFPCNFFIFQNLFLKHFIRNVFIIQAEDGFRIM